MTDFPYLGLLAIGFSQGILFCGAFFPSYIPCLFLVLLCLLFSLVDIFVIGYPMTYSSHYPYL